MPPLYDLHKKAMTALCNSHKVDFGGLTDAMTAWYSRLNKAMTALHKASNTTGQPAMVETIGTGYKGRQQASNHKIN